MNIDLQTKENKKTLFEGYMKKILAGCLFMSLCCIGISQQFNEVEGFKFNVYEFDLNSEVSAAKTNTPIVNENFRVIVSDDGHLETNGARFRIFGTNLSELPAKTEARKFAEFLAFQGYNCVRFHHVDASWTKALVKKDEVSGKWVISENGLDRFDYFVNELKKLGIYTNINLLTGREISSKEGLPKSIDKVKDWKAKHCYGFWNKEARDLQKQYAKELLSHKNPYTGFTYLEDPAVAIIEINNENGLMQGYLNSLLVDYDDSLWSELEQKWNDWLKKKNYNLTSLSKKYNKEFPIGKHLVDKNTRWNLENHAGASAKVLGTQGSYKIEVKKPGKENWHIQYNCSKLMMQEGMYYTVKFTAKASKPLEVDFSLQQAHDPWRNAGWYKRFELDKEWKTFETIAVCGLSDDNLRLNIGNLGLLKDAEIYIKDVEIFEGGKSKIVEESNIFPKMVKLPRRGDYDSLSNEYKNLIMNFFYDVEEDYWSDMLKFLKNDLGSKSLVMGTVIGCSSVGLMNMFDIIDAHAYWNHPVFPNEDWNRSDFYVENKDLTKDNFGGTLTSLACQRVYGKPFSVSEYDHPYPNQFGAQMYPMFASYASFQDWDCIYTFCSEIPTFGFDKIKGFFDQSNNPVKAGAAPFAARIFKEALVESGKSEIYIEYDNKKERELLCKDMAWNISSVENLGVEKAIALKYKFGRLYKENNVILKNGVNYDSVKLEIPVINQRMVEEKDGLFTEGKQLYWNARYGNFIVQNPNVSISILNKSSILPTYPGEWIQSDMLLPIVQNADFVTFCAVKNSEDWLIFSASWCGNKKENLKLYGSKSIQNKAVAIREPIPLISSFEEKAEVFMLSGDGILGLKSKYRWQLFEFNNKGQIKEPETPQRGTVFSFNQNSGTLWYKLTPIKNK